ncbi:MAG: helix-turn-helix domain-containing protein [Bacteroidota bacterium]
MAVSILTKDDLRPLEDMLHRILETLVAVTNQTAAPFMYDNESLAKALGVCQRTLQHYRNSGLIRYSKVERRVFYRREDVENFLLTHSNAPYQEDSKSKQKKPALRFNNKISNI